MMHNLILSIKTSGKGAKLQGAWPRPSLPGCHDERR